MVGWTRSLCVFSALVSVAYCANILVVSPTLSKSHYVMFGELIDELLNRGHQITVITTFPHEKPMKNLTEISVRSVRTVIFNEFAFSLFDNIPEYFFDVAPHFFLYIQEAPKVFSAQGVTDLIKSNSTFDLVIYEMFLDDVFLGFAHRFKAPVIALGSCYMFPFVPDRFAIPANPSYFPGFYSAYSDKMDFIQRLHNAILDLAGKAFYKYFLEPEMTEIARKYFGSDTPSVGELIKTTSLYFTNNHFSFYGAHPYPPQVVDISGIHLKPTKPLAKVISFK